MYTAVVKKHFDAAHRLVNYDGLCSNVHGHRWYVEVAVSSHQLNNQSMVVDFKNLKSIVGDVCRDYDHSFLNDKEVQPTAENLSYKIYQKVKQGLQQKPYNVVLKFVRVYETPEDYIEYSENV